MKNIRQKGNDFEREASQLLTDKIKNSKFRRIPSSGAIGTSLGEPLLTGDISGIVDGYHKRFKIEAKTGYGGSKQFTLKKEWLDKILQEAENNYSMPLLIGKFSGSRAGVKVFVIMDIDTFAEVINKTTDCTKQLEELSKE